MEQRKEIIMRVIANISSSNIFKLFHKTTKWIDLPVKQLFDFGMVENSNGKHMKHKLQTALKSKLAFHLIGKFIIKGVGIKFYIS